MTPLAKLAIISEANGEASLSKNHLVFLHLLYILIEKQPFLVSTSSYQLFKIVFNSSHVSYSDGFKKSRETKWQILTTYYVSVILDNLTM